MKEDLDLKSLLKTLKLNENSISTALGLIVIVVLGFLVINYFRNLPTGETFPEGASIEDSSLQEGVHIVSEGESLWTIAELEYGSGYDWVKIAEANDITNPNEIEKGQELVIPDTEEQIAEVISDNATVELVEETEPEEAPAETTSETTYTVQRGDHLWKIAEETYGDGYRWVDIAKVNNLANPDIIHTGNVLILPE